MNGFDQTATVMALAKQYIGMCDGTGDITLPKETLKIMLTAFTGIWHGHQDVKRAEFKKVAGSA